MHRYGLPTNYLELKEKYQNKGATLYIDERPKETGNIAGFINNTQPRYTLKQPNYIFERHEGNCVFLYSIKLIATREEKLINYNLN